ncbi:PREDICTED: UPF0764 protein C16orf89 homolog [Chrysochloris asiatica]|uniref:UPF0764 protein C16orf89 homolog n=1 Tax=Chrysochloris asiatica TaxID=185453 RepID=A0A9B0U7J0_CHRAS|nr:PREDICTED: UPF0764 protein C16orf89 homolog [Chrysochloris asiatica]
MCGLGRLLLLLLLTPLWLQVSSLPQPDTPEGKATTAGLILSALERATVFLEERLPDFNLDGIVGFQVLQVQLRGVHKVWAGEPQLQLLNLRVGRLAQKLLTLLHRSTSYLKLSDPTYLQEFQPIIQPGFWKLPHSWTRTNASMVYPTFETEDAFSENHSDHCLVQLLGTGMDGSQPCRLPDFCRTLMTRTGCSGYSLSHQLIYFLFARMIGCTKGPFQQNQHYMDLFCANMMNLNQRVEVARYPYPTQDLFMENIMLCGFGGFVDFYKFPWLEAILRWQKQREGCFGKPAPEDNEFSKAAQHHQQFLTRVKRREKVFPGGCSAHNTAMAVGSLGGFLYALAERPPAHRKPLQSTPSPPSVF